MTDSSNVAKKKKYFPLLITFVFFFYKTDMLLLCAQYCLVTLHTRYIFMLFFSCGLLKSAVTFKFFSQLQFPHQAAGLDCSCNEEFPLFIRANLALRQYPTFKHNLVLSGPCSFSALFCSQRHYIRVIHIAGKTQPMHVPLALLLSPVKVLFIKINNNLANIDSVGEVGDLFLLLE